MLEMTVEQLKLVLDRSFNNVSVSVIRVLLELKPFVNNLDPFLAVFFTEFGLVHEVVLLCDGFGNDKVAEFSSCQLFLVGKFLYDCQVHAVFEHGWEVKMMGLVQGQ